MARSSAGLLIYRRGHAGVEVLLVHPGGPFWAKKDRRAWSIPKGEADPGEDLLAAAHREFAEETGFTVGQGGEAAVALTPLRQRGGKTVHAWAMEGDCDPSALRSNSFTMEWPPRSGRSASFPEIDKAAWFSLEEARERLHEGQIPLIDELEARL